MRLCFFSCLLLAASGVAAQEADDPIMLPPVQVLTIQPQGDGFVYDLDGQDESVAYLRAGGFLIVRVPGDQQALVLAEPDSAMGGTEVANAITVGGGTPVGVLPFQSAGYYGPRLSSYTVTVLVCTSASGDECTEWKAARPLASTSGDRLRLTVVDTSDDRAPVYEIPAPAPPDGTMVPDGDRTRQ